MIKFEDIIDFDPYTLSIETVQYVLKQSTVKYNEFQFVIFFDTLVSAKVYDLLLCKDKNVIVFSSNSFDKIPPFFTSEEIVFSYSFEDAVQDGSLTPAMNPKALEATIDVFSKQLLEQFGYYPITAYPNTPNKEWDLVVCKDQQKYGSNIKHTKIKLFHLQPQILY